MTNTSSDHYLEELVRGASLAFANAEDLFREGETLFACKALSRAMFLHQISLEECGKVEMLGWWITGHLMGSSINPRKMKSHLASHKAKNFANAYMLSVGDAERKARAGSDWRASVPIFREKQAKFHQESNTLKNASLYVDFVGDKFLAPGDRITEDMVQEIATRNHTFIELMRPKVQMLTLWVQEADATRETMKHFRKRMEELKEKHPDEPQKALDIILEEMVAQAIKITQKAMTPEDNAQQ